MLDTAKNIVNNPKYSRVFQWGKLISVTGAAQIIVQITGLATGIFLIRFLPTKEYAYYTIANAMLSTIIVLGDGGIGTGVTAFGGKVWGNKEKLGEVLATGLSLRKAFSICSFVAVSPILIFLLSRQGAVWWEIIVMLMAVIPAFLASINDSLLEIIPKLQQDITGLQKNQLQVAIIRLILTLCTVMVFPFTAIALLANGLPRIYGNIKLRSIAYNYVDKDSKPTIELKKSIVSIVKLRMPEVIYYSFSGQITIWLLSLLGTTTAIAQVGALSRLSILTSSLTLVAGMLVIPRFARLPNNRVVIYKKFLISFTIVLIALFALLTFIWLISDKILILLGFEYKGLDTELLLFLLGNSFVFLANYTYSLFSSRGWLMNPLISITINALSLLVCSYFIQVNSLTGAINFGFANAVIQLTVNVTFMLYSIAKNTR